MDCAAFEAVVAEAVADGEVGFCAAVGGVGDVFVEVVADDVGGGGGAVDVDVDAGGVAGAVVGDGDGGPLICGDGGFGEEFDGVAGPHVVEAEGDLPFSRRSS